MFMSKCSKQLKRIETYYYLISNYLIIIELANVAKIFSHFNTTIRTNLSNLEERSASTRCLCLPIDSFISFSTLTQ